MSRPRMTFDEKGFCSACQWTEEKKLTEVQEREKMLRELLDKHRSQKKI